MGAIRQAVQDFCISPESNNARVLSFALLQEATSKCKHNKHPSHVQCFQILVRGKAFALPSIMCFWILKRESRNSINVGAAILYTCILEK